MHLVEAIGEVFHYLNNEGNIYAPFVFGILLGSILTFGIMSFTLWRLGKFYQRLMQEKDSMISALKILVSEKLKNIKVNPTDKKLFNGLKKFFRNGSKIEVAGKQKKA